MSWPDTVRLVPALALTLLVPAAGSAQEERFVGCYDVDAATWAPEDPGSDSHYYMPPARIRLSLDEGLWLGGTPPGNAVETIPGAMPSIHRYSWWRAVEPDSIVVTWSTGFTALELRLAGGDTLRGIAHTRTDTSQGGRYMANARAVRVDCDAPLEPEQRIDYGYAPSVRLAGGDSLVLDQPPPLRLNIPDSAGAHIIAVTTLAPYDQADTITVSVRNGLVRSIVLHYPEHIGFESLLERLTAEFGTPTSMPQPSWRVAHWTSRLMTIALADASIAEDGLRVHIQTRRFQRSPSPSR